MKFLFISSQPYPYGMAASKRIRLFAEFLAQKHEVHAFVCGRNNKRNKKKGVRNSVEWQLIKFKRFEYFLNIAKIYSVLKKNYSINKRNIIILYDGIGLTNILFAIIGKRLGYKIFTDIVEDYTVSDEKESIARKALIKINQIFQHRISNYTNGIIVISSILKEKYLKLVAEPKNIVLIPISAENINIQISKHQNNKLTFVYGGSYGVKDGVELLITAFINLTSSFSEVKLLLVGNITSEITNLISTNSNIEYIGYIPDNYYYTFLKNADVLLMTRINSPYANSGFPFKLGEYLASGNAVITTNVSDIEYYLVDKKDAIFAKPSDLNSLIHAMEFAVQNKKELSEIGECGRKKCLKFFNPGINGAILETFINNIVPNTKV